MRLIRMVRLTYPIISKEWDKWNYNVNDIKIGSMHKSSDEKLTKFLVYAIKDLKYKPKITRENLIVVPDSERKSLEIAIEHVANLISLDQEVKRRITSINPPIAFFPETPEELNWLNATNGIYLTRNKKIPVKGTLGVNINKMLANLNDRMDGVSLLVEAICQEHSSGKFREYTRIFERAFKLPIRKTLKPLYSFLSKNLLGYTEIEIEQWINVRDPLTHADQREEFYLESDVIRYINRMEQASYDVIFNKLNWRSPDVQRRKIWKPISGSTGNNSNILITRGQAQKFTFQFFDAFGVFIEELSSINKLPKGFWFKNNGKLHATE